MTLLVNRNRLAVLVVGFIVAFGLLGSRGIWDPDEGRYTNVALNMLDSGDWINPRRNDDVGHWTKPPVTYWAIAASVAVLGRNPWAARLPVALAYLLTIAITWRLARRLAPGAEDIAALAFATMLLPIVASQLITTDLLLTAFEALAVLAYVEARFDGPGHRLRWWLAMGAAFGLAFLTKGPPALLPLLAIVVFEWLVPLRGAPRTGWSVATLAFLLVATPWFAAVSIRHPGLFQHLFDAEVVDRVASNRFARNEEWYGWAVVYLPTLLVGTLPWTAAMIRWVRKLPSKARQWRGRQQRLVDKEELLLTLWIAVPLLIFCFSRSRLPLYVLPLFVAVAVLVARQHQSEKRGLPSLRWMAVVIVGVMGLRAAAIFMPSSQNAAEWATEIQKRSEVPVQEVVFIEDKPRYGLKLHLDAEVERVSLTSMADAGFNTDFDETLAEELTEAEPGVIFVVPEKHWPAVTRELNRLGHDHVVLGGPHRSRVLFAISAP